MVIWGKSGFDNADGISVEIASRVNKVWPSFMSETAGLDPGLIWGLLITWLSGQKCPYQVTPVLISISWCHHARFMLIECLCIVWMCVCVLCVCVCVPLSYSLWCLHMLLHRNSLQFGADLDSDNNIKVWPKPCVREIRKMYFVWKIEPGITGVVHCDRREPLLWRGI